MKTFLIKLIIPGTWLAFAGTSLVAQSSGVPLGSPAYHIAERIDVLRHTDSPIHYELKFFARQDLAEIAISADSSSRLSRLDRQDLRYLLNDNNEWAPQDSLSVPSRRKGLFRAFYQTPANFFEVNSRDFKLRANPMLNLGLGRQNDDAELVFINQRGLEVRGEVDKKVFFYTNLIETQARFPNYVNDWIERYKAVPGAGLVKSYRPRNANLTDAYDFNVATAYLGFKMTKHISFQLGHGRHFIGDGYRSLLLSDIGGFAFYLKLNTRVWRFHYQNLFLELSPTTNLFETAFGSLRLPRKYAAMHYLSYRITPRLSIGLFETVMFNGSRQFELQYLNPVILYRTVEGLVGSPDNVLIGFNANWNPVRGVKLYGQFLLDEFLFSQLVKPEQSGWWGNKYGAQLGLKYFNALSVDHLDLQFEWNRVRPYTYSHFDSLNAYTHYRQPLAHPLWSGFNEFLVLARYQPIHRLTMQARFIRMLNGDDIANQNWGNNPLLSNSWRVQDFGNDIAQGIRADTDLLGIDVSWMLFHNIFVDFRYLYRNKNSADDRYDRRTSLIGGGIRMNLWNPNLDF